MSSFIVNDSCINKILSYLNRHSGDYRWAFKSTGLDLYQFDDLQELGSRLYLLNCDAVDARYSRGTAAGDTVGTDYHFAFTLCDGVAALKALQCWSYQCSEGDIDQRPLFLTMQQVRLALAEKLVREYAPNYETAAWGS